MGRLPPSLGKIRNLWVIDMTGTRLNCAGADALGPDGTLPPLEGPGCPLPEWLRFTDDYFFQPNMLECPGVTFA